jgi:predicted DNA-binding protein YlxM (UPF0122 family)
MMFEVKKVVIGMDKSIESHLLYDHYSRLLTDRQREAFELHFFEDLSLAEIAEELKVSRQAVHDTVTRTMVQLQDYEDKLKLFTLQQQRERAIDNIRSRLKAMSICDQVLDMLLSEIE